MILCVCMCVSVDTSVCVCTTVRTRSFALITFFLDAEREKLELFSHAYDCYKTHIYITHIYMCVYVYYLRLYYTITIMINSPPFSREKEKERRTYWAPIYLSIHI